MRKMYIIFVSLICANILLAYDTDKIGYLIAKSIINNALKTQLEIIDKQKSEILNPDYEEPIIIKDEENKDYAFLFKAPPDMEEAINQYACSQPRCDSAFWTVVDWINALALLGLNGQLLVDFFSNSPITGRQWAITIFGDMAGTALFGLSYKVKKSIISTEISSLREDKAFLEEAEKAAKKYLNALLNPIEKHDCNINFLRELFVLLEKSKNKLKIEEDKLLILIKNAREAKLERF